MPRHCSACDHPDRALVDQRLAGGEPFRNIARDTGLSVSALARHKTAHLGPALRDAIARRGDDAADRAVDVRRAQETAATLAAFDLVERLTLSNAAIRRAMAGSMASGDWGLMLRAASSMDKQTRLIAELQGELSDGAVVTVVTSPEWTAVRAVIVSALAPWPEARIHVAAALAALEAAS